MWNNLLQYINALPGFLYNLVLAILAILSGFVFKIIASIILRKQSDPTVRYSFFRSLVYRLNVSLTIFLPLLILNLVLPLMRLKPQAFIVLDKIVGIFLIISFAAILIAIIKVAEDYFYHLQDLTKQDNLRERKLRTQLQFLRRIAVGVIVILAVCAVLLSFSSLRRLGAGLLTGVGVGGLIIGFASQRILGNLLAGFQIAFTQPIRIDDVLVVEGEWGRVEEINLTYVVLMIWDQRRLILPINYFIEKPFQNWTRSTAEILGTTFIYLDYTAPVEALRAEYERLLAESPLWDKRVCVLQVTNATEQIIELRALMSAANSSQAFDLRCIIREKLVAFIQQNYPECLPKTRAVIDRPVL